VLPFANITVDGAELASSGTRVTDVTRVPLRLGDDTIGEMEVGLRQGQLRGRHRERPRSLQSRTSADDCAATSTAGWDRPARVSHTPLRPPATSSPPIRPLRTAGGRTTRSPPEFREDMRVEVDETPRGLTILECRPPWNELMGSEWTRAPIARLTYSKQAGSWTLYYADRNERFQRYWECEPSAHVADLLEEIDADLTCICWRTTGGRCRHPRSRSCSSRSNGWRNSEDRPNHPRVSTVTCGPATG
jgi:hypothetical protein